ncbi:MAG: efflux RND transporter periplasmic adaptor subunit [Pseudomonadota bacterium]
MKRGFLGILAVAAWLGLALLLAGCSRDGQASKDGDKTAKRPPVAVETVKVAPADLVEGIEVVGSLAPKFEASVKSEYAGIVAEVMVDQWVRVKKGQPLARLDTREASALVGKAQAGVEAAKAGLLQAEVGQRRSLREHQRLIKLKEVGLVTQQNLDDAKTDEEASQARVEAAKAQLKVAMDDLSFVRTRLSKALILAPFDGVVAYRGINVGDMVGEAGSNKVMFKVVDTYMLELTVNVPSREMAALKLGQPLEFSTDAYPGRDFHGKVMFINPTVNEADRSVKVVMEVPNQDEVLKGGLFAKGRIITGTRQGVLQLPRAALTTWDVVQGKAELMISQDQVARRRSVKTGAVKGDLVEISEGLRAGDEVITRGGFNVKDGDKIKVVTPGAS